MSVVDGTRRGEECLRCEERGRQVLVVFSEEAGSASEVRRGGKECRECRDRDRLVSMVSASGSPCVALVLEQQKQIITKNLKRRNK
jgi:hypothetical protein